MMLCPVLFTEKNSSYLQITGTDCYDIKRNALTMPRGLPIVAHPPCRLWSRLRFLSTAPRWERWLAVWSIVYVRKYGGVVEHPSGSSIFHYMNIPLSGAPDQYGGFLVSVDQNWFGHPARKRTYLYMCGVQRSQIPPHPLSFMPIKYSVSNSKQLEELPQRLRNHTPLCFAKWLVGIQSIIRANKHSSSGAYFRALSILVYLQLDISTSF